MELLEWKYTKRRGIEATFNDLPHSKVIFRPVNHYYVVYHVIWSNLDPVVIRADLEEMESILNGELGIDRGIRRNSMQV